MAGTIFAATQGYFKEFFQSDVPQDALLYLNETQIDDGVEMKISEVMPGGNEAVFILEFIRTDGEAFQKTDDVAYFDFAVDGQRGGFSGISRKLLDDGKKLVYCYEMMSDRSVLGRTVEIKADGIFTPAPEIEAWEVPLAQWNDAYQIWFGEGDLQMWQDEAIEALTQELVTQGERAGDAPALPLQNKYPDNRFAGVAYIGYTFKDEGKTIEKELDIQEAVSWEGHQEGIRLTRVTVSVLGLCLEGVWEEGSQAVGIPPGYAPTVSAVLKDGRILKFKSDSQQFAEVDSITGEPVNSFQKQFGLVLDREEAGGEKAFISQETMSQIKELRVDHHVIEVK